MGYQRSLCRSGCRTIIGSRKGQRKIAVEIKSFVGPSELDDLEKALGQYILYYDILAEVEPDRKLYVAVTEEIFVDLFAEPVGQLVIARGRIRLLVFDQHTQEIRRWIPEPPTSS